MKAYLTFSWLSVGKTKVVYSSSSLWRNTHGTFIPQQGNSETKMRKRRRVLKSKTFIDDEGYIGMKQNKDDHLIQHLTLNTGYVSQQLNGTCLFLPIKLFGCEMFSFRRVWDFCRTSDIIEVDCSWLVVLRSCCESFHVLCSVSPRRRKPRFDSVVRLN